MMLRTSKEVKSLLKMLLLLLVTKPVVKSKEVKPLLLLFLLLESSLSKEINVLPTSSRPWRR
jgi:hypothetical protein